MTVVGFDRNLQRNSSEVSRPNPSSWIDDLLKRQCVWSALRLTVDLPYLASATVGCRRSSRPCSNDVLLSRTPRKKVGGTLVPLHLTCFNRAVWLSASGDAIDFGPGAILTPQLQVVGRGWRIVFHARPLHRYEPLERFLSFFSERCYSLKTSLNYRMSAAWPHSIQLLHRAAQTHRKS